MKYFLYFLLAVILLAGYLVTGAEHVSANITKWAESNKTEPEIEKYAFYNIVYTNFVGKYKTSLELCDKYIEKYDKYDVYDKKDEAEKRIDLVNFYRADNLDRLLDTFNCKKAYYHYIEKFPEGEKIKRVRERMRELNFN